MQVLYMVRQHVNEDVLWANHTCNVPKYIRGHAPSIWDLYPNMISYFVTKVLLFGLIWGGVQCIDPFLLNLVVMNHVGWDSQRRYIILWGDDVPINCFHYGAQFSCHNPFYTLMTS